MTLRPVGGALLTLAAGAAGFLIAGLLLGSVAVDGFGAGLAATALVAVVNGLAWPALVRLALPLTVLTLGVGVLVANGLVVLLVARVLPGTEVDGLAAAIAVVLVATAATTLASAIASIDDDGRMARHLVRRAQQRREPAERSDVPGVLFLEIDGLAHDVLRRALRDGHAPELAAWIREGTHRLHPWETDLSSQTGACQAGLLHGSNEDMPAFRWWEKDRDRAIVTNHPRDAAELERRVSDGRGLLHAGGASRANILSGDAPHTLLTMSTILDPRRPNARIGHAYFHYFASPYNVARTLLLALADIAAELRAAALQRRRDVRPRVHRGFKYALVRAWATVVQRDLQVEAVLADVYAGRPVVYSTFLAYDEVAHHSGTERADALTVLGRLDRAVARIAAAARRAPRPYRIVVLSDHGQSQGATFLQRYGITLERLVADACAAPALAAAEPEDEALGQLRAAMAEARRDAGAGARVLRGATKDRFGAPAAPETDLPEIVVMASGCLGLISFPRMEGRATREQIDERYPALLPALRAHPGIGWALVRSGPSGVVYGAGGERRLADGTVRADDPLAAFGGQRAARHLARTDGFAHCPDVLVNSTYWPDLDEVAAFEELVGSHGGLGGGQSAPFVLAPADLPWPDGEVVGAEAAHRVLRGWLAGLGHDGHRPLARR